ncbi:MAG TPA: hypothetical protein PLW93_00155 [Candidatus Absconditabacterales bacterium]|nr:hypothetical protein [Candidatus Absconditabacterales bacterium]
MKIIHPRLVSIVMIIVSIPLGMVIFRYLGFWGSSQRILPVDDKISCVFQLINNNHTIQGIISYRTGGVRITAKHVLFPSIYDDSDIQGYKDRVRFTFQDRYYYLQSILHSSGDLVFITINNFNTNYCTYSHLDGLVTYESGIQKIIPVVHSGIIIDYTPYPGQSGSPVFVQGKLMGVVSRRFEGGIGGVLELIDNNY